jgi:flavin reductase (DIM6/NTAB) family NADH-FMN oxidoreductase RutF
MAKHGEAWVLQALPMQNHTSSMERRPDPTPTRVIQPSVLYFGTPVAILSTIDDEGHVNLTPMSSAWALGDRVVLGLSDESQGCANILATGEAVINLPDPAQQASVERLAPTTGRNPVPSSKLPMGYKHESDKFGLAGWSAVPSELVRPPRVGECPMQLEARLLGCHSGAADPKDRTKSGYCILEMQVVRVHAHEHIVFPGTHHVDPSRWSPLLYVFRHYFGTGAPLGRNFRAET